MFNYVTLNYFCLNMLNCVFFSLISLAKVEHKTKKKFCQKFSAEDSFYEQIAFNV